MEACSKRFLYMLFGGGLSKTILHVQHGISSGKKHPHIISYTRLKCKKCPTLTVMTIASTWDSMSSLKGQSLVIIVPNELRSGKFNKPEPTFIISRICEFTMRVGLDNCERTSLSKQPNKIMHDSKLWLTRSTWIRNHDAHTPQQMLLDVFFCITKQCFLNLCWSKTPTRATGNGHANSYDELQAHGISAAEFRKFDNLPLFATWKHDAWNAFLLAFLPFGMMAYDGTHTSYLEIFAWTWRKWVILYNSVWLSNLSLLYYT